MNTRLTQKNVDATMPHAAPPNGLSPITEAAGMPLPSHGGQVRAVMRYFASAPEPFIDLSTGINPFAYPLALPDPGTLHHLPEEEDEQALQQVAALAYGVPTPEMVVTGAGSQSLIALLPRLLRVRRACVLGPTYSGHQQAWEQNGVPCDMLTHVAQMTQAAQQVGTVCVICNPNNPDGRLLDLQTLAALAEHCAQAGSWLVVDEAFGDFENQSVATMLPHPALVVLRSFGKTYGLPGVRLGFLLAAPELAQKARALLGAWPVGAVALAAGQQALADTHWLHQAAQIARRAHDRLTDLLHCAGLACRGQSSLFTLVENAHAWALWAHFCRYGIVTRRFAERAHWLRIGLPATEAAWTRLECALKAWQVARPGGE